MLYARAPAVRIACLPPTLTNHAPLLPRPQDKSSQAARHKELLQDELRDLRASSNRAATDSESVRLALASADREVARLKHHGEQLQAKVDKQAAELVVAAQEAKKAAQQIEVR